MPIVTDPELLALLNAGNANNQPSVDLADVAKSSGIGAAKGTIGLAGLPGDLVDLVNSGLNAGNRYLVGKGLAQPRGESGPNPLPTAASIQKGVEGYTGEFYKPKTKAGQYAQTVGEFAPAALAGPGGIARRVAFQAVAPGLASEAAGQATQGTASEPWARLAAAVATPGTAAHLITPFPASERRQALVQALQKEGVTDLTAGQIVGSRPLQWTEQSLTDIPFGGNRADILRQSQAEQLTAAALKRAGIDSNRLTPEVIDKQGFERLGKVFDDIEQRNTLTPTPQMTKDITDVVKEYSGFVAESNRSPVVGNYVKEIADALQQHGGVIPGKVYQSITSRIRESGRNVSQNEARDALRGLQIALDDAMEHSMGAAGNTADMKALREARNQYRNLMVLEKVATAPKSPLAAGEELVDPAALARALNQQNRRDYARGHGDFAELAHAAERIMKPLPQSGTGPRIYAMSLPLHLGAMIAGGSQAGLEGAMLGAAGPPAVGRVLMHPITQSILSNQALAGQPSGPINRNLARALLYGTATEAAQQPR
jgi:hypothetical protein